MAKATVTSLSLYEGDNVDIHLLNTTQPAPNTRTSCVIRVANNNGVVQVELFDEATQVVVQTWKGV